MALHPERTCVLCGHPEGFAVDVLGRSIGPVAEDARSKTPLWVHRECAIWSPEVCLERKSAWPQPANDERVLAHCLNSVQAYETGDGHIRGISRVLKRGRVTWYALCLACTTPLSVFLAFSGATQQPTAAATAVMNCLHCHT